MGGPNGWELFEQQDATAANAGIQLRAVNSDVVAGIGAGVELSGLATLDLEKDVVGSPMQLPSGTWGDPELTGGWISQAYLTYGFGNTSIKVGRQELPKSLSPFAFSEDWNVWANTYDAALLVNTDLPDTTAVLAYVRRANLNFLYALAPMFAPGPDAVAMNHFNSLNGSEGVWMLTLQNKSIENVTLTGSYYDFNGDYLMWADAQITAGAYSIGLQGGKVEGYVKAIGAKVATSFDGIDVALAYSNTSNGSMFNVGGTTSALYTCTVGNQLIGSAEDEDKLVFTAATEAWGGNISAALATIDYNGGDYDELDLVYSTNITDSFNLTAAYVYMDGAGDSLDVIRLVGTYNF